MNKQESIKELNIVSDKISNTLKDSKLNYGQMINILEMLKMDIIINSKMVTLDGKPLERIEINNQRKKDNCEAQTSNYLETRSKTGEENKEEHIPVDVDNHADNAHRLKDLMSDIPIDFVKMVDEICQIFNVPDNKKPNIQPNIQPNPDVPFGLDLSNLEQRFKSCGTSIQDLVHVFTNHIQEMPSSSHRKGRTGNQ